MIQEKINRLRKEINDRNKEIDNLENILKLYPDATLEYTKSGKYNCCSASVNNKVNKVTITHSCGCCPGASLVAFPYIETEYGNIYSHPHIFYIGKRDTLYDNWKNQLKAANISDEILEQIKNHKKIYDEALEARENVYRV